MELTAASHVGHCRLQHSQMLLLLLLLSGCKLHVVSLLLSLFHSPSFHLSLSLCCVFLMGFHLFAINLSLFIFIIVRFLCSSARLLLLLLLLHLCLAAFSRTWQLCTCVSLCVCVSVRVRVPFALLCVRAINCYYRHDAACRRRPRRRLPLAPQAHPHLLLYFHLYALLDDDRHC